MTSDLARLRFREMRGDFAVLTVPGTDYELHLPPRRPISVEPGKRVSGTIHANALRVHLSEGGGNWIEPVYGHPRIVQGTVERIDADRNRLLINVGVPMWVTLTKAQAATDFSPGRMLNFYVESGVAFEPASGTAGS